MVCGRLFHTGAPVVLWTDDVAGTRRTCFMILHDVRGLSVHFMLDLDGTIY